MSQLLTSGGQSIGASASVLPVTIQCWFPLGLTGLISLLSKGLSRVFSSNTVWKHQFFSAQLSLWSNSHIHTWLLEKPQLWLDGPLSAKWCLCFLLLYPVIEPVTIFEVKQTTATWGLSFVGPLAACETHVESLKPCQRLGAAPDKLHEASGPGHQWQDSKLPGDCTGEHWFWCPIWFSHTASVPSMAPSPASYFR